MLAEAPMDELVTMVTKAINPVVSGWARFI